MALRVGRLRWRVSRGGSIGWLETFVFGLGVLVLLIGLGMMAETFRSVPWSRDGARRPGLSPRQRRWLGAGLSLPAAGQLLSSRLEGDTPLWAVSFALIIGGAVCAIAAFLEADQR